jgi:hypothetical protein
LLAYPNPFNNKTNISFTLAQSNHTSIRVYNSLGKEVAVLYDGNAEAAQSYKVELDGSNLPEGFYYCKLQSGNIVNTVKKLILVK